MNASKQSAIFADTSFFLHFKPLKEIDWCSVTASQSVKIFVASVTTDELNNKKDTGNTKAIRARALAALKLLEAVVDSDTPYEIRPGVTIEFVTDSYSNYDAHNLDRLVKDDVLLLAAINYRDQNAGVDTLLLANDVGFRAKAKQRQLKAIKILDEWKLQPAPDPEQKELAELRAQAAARPRLEVLFSDGKAHYQSIRPRPPFNDSSLIRQTMTKLHKKFPTYDPATGPVLSLNETVVRAYNEKVLEFYELYERVLPTWLNHEQERSRTVYLNLKVSNVGTRPANDVSIFLDFPDGPFEIYGYGTECPDFPSPPPPLRTGANPMELVFDEFPSYQNFHVGPMVHHEKDFAFVSVNGRRVTLTIAPSKLQQGQSRKLETVYVEFHDYTNMKGFSIKSSVLADEISETQLTNLDVQVREGGQEAHWRIPLVS